MVVLPRGGFWRDERNRLPANLVLGTIANNQLEAEQRIPALLQVPVQTRFISHIDLNGPITYPLNGAFRPSSKEGVIGEELFQCVCCGAGVWENSAKCPSCGYAEKTEWAVTDLIHFVQLPDPLLPSVNQQWAQQLRLDYQRAGVPIFGEADNRITQASHS